MKVSYILIAIMLINVILDVPDDEGLSVVEVGEVADLHAQGDLFYSREPFTESQMWPSKATCVREVEG